MTDVLKPRDAKDVQDAIQWALSEAKTLEVMGRGSKRALGRPSQSDMTLDLSGLSGVTLYEPEELVLSALAGTPIGRSKPWLGRAASSSSSNRWTTARSSAATLVRGLARRHHRVQPRGPAPDQVGCRRAITFLGFSAVSGRGEAFKSGGRVVKNVTGYDLCKLLAGSYGTLAAMLDITIKTLPKPETEESVVVAGLTTRARPRRCRPRWHRPATCRLRRICRATW
jgi:glycolate oxidase FAD binding subunit